MHAEVDPPELETYICDKRTFRAIIWATAKDNSGQEIEVIPRYDSYAVWKSDAPAFADFPNPLEGIVEAYSGDVTVAVTAKTPFASATASIRAKKYGQMTIDPQSPHVNVCATTDLKVKVKVKDLCPPGTCSATWSGGGSVALADKQSGHVKGLKPGKGSIEAEYVYTKQMTGRQCSQPFTAVDQIAVDGGRLTFSVTGTLHYGGYTFSYMPGSVLTIDTSTGLATDSNIVIQQNGDKFTLDNLGINNSIELFWPNSNAYGSLLIQPFPPGFKGFGGGRMSLAEYIPDLAYVYRSSDTTLTQLPCVP